MSNIDRQVIFDWFTKTGKLKSATKKSKDLNSFYDQVSEFNPEMQLSSIYGHYKLHYSKAINTLLKKNSDASMSIALLLLIYQYLELYVKEICWDYDKDNTFRQLRLNNHNLVNILKDQKNRIINELQVHTEEEFQELCSIIEDVNSFSGSANNSSVSFRYPIRTETNTVEMILNDIKEMTNEKLNHIWDRINVIYQWYIVNNVVNHFESQKNVENITEIILFSINATPGSYQPLFFLKTKNDLGKFLQENLLLKDLFPKKEPGLFKVKNQIIEGAFHNVKEEIYPGCFVDFGFSGNIITESLGKNFIKLTHGAMLLIKSSFKNDSSMRKYVEGYMKVLFNVDKNQYRINRYNDNKITIVRSKNIK